MGACPVASVLSDPVTPWTGARQTPLSMGFSRQEYWNGFSCATIWGWSLWGSWVPHSAGKLPHSLMTIGPLPLGLIFWENTVSLQTQRRRFDLSKSKFDLSEFHSAGIFFFLSEVQRQIENEVKEKLQSRTFHHDWLWLILSQKHFQTPKPYCALPNAKLRFCPNKR